MKKIILLLMMIHLPTSAQASTQTGKISSIQVRDDGLHWFYIEGSRSLKPTCATHEYWMIKDENSAYGKSQFSMLLSAYMGGKEIVIHGKNTCSRWGDGEDVGTVQLK